MSERREARPALEPVVDDPSAPVLFFDMIPTCGGFGTIHVSLACIRHVPKDGRISSVPKIVAHLRCDRAVATNLKDALTKALAMGEPTVGGMS